MVELRGIEPLFLECHPSVLPLNYNPNVAGLSHAVTQLSRGNVSPSGTHSGNRTPQPLHYRERSANELREPPNMVRWEGIEPYLCHVTAALLPNSYPPHSKLGQSTGIEPAFPHSQ